MSGLIQEIAEYTAELRWSDIPKRTRKLARAQLLGWLGSVAAGWTCDEAAGVCQVAQGLGDQRGVTFWPGESPPMSVRGAAYLSAALSCAHDYDDYLFLAHTSHSACGVPWFLAQVEGATVGDVLTAIVAANEIMGRLGAACLVGPQNGQLWTFVHLAGAVIGASKIRGWRGDSVAQALSVAFIQPPFALWSGFGASPAKILSAATPTLLGLMAVEHAATGLTGAGDSLEGSGGFFDRFSFMPMADVFDDLGRTWVTNSISVKPVPGCAYVTAPALAALECVEQFVEKQERPLSPSEITRVEVLAGPMTIGMERLLGHHCRQPPYAPVSVNFSVPLTVASALLHGRLDPDDLTEQSLTAHASLLAQIASKIELGLDGGAARSLFREVGIKSGLLGRFRKRGLRAATAGIAQALRASAPPAGKSPVQPLGRVSRAAVLRVVREFWKKPEGLSMPGGEVSFPFGATVRVETRAGLMLESEMKVPDGAAGSGEVRVQAVARAKLVRECSRFAPEDLLQSWADKVLAGETDDQPVSEVISKLR